jgi:hypothetical protein
MGGGGGAGGMGGMGAAWPTCNSPDPGAMQQTINAIWQANPTQPQLVWVPGVYVSAISRGGCIPGQACQIFVQSQTSYPDLGSASKQSLRLFVSSATAMYFTGVKVGDKVDVQAYAYRYTMNGENELLLQVTAQLKGCAKTVGMGTLAPLVTTLDVLTVDAYENTMGPVLVHVDGVSGKPALPTETFGLWTTGMFNDAGIQTVTSLSPFFLAANQFAGLTQAKTHDFKYVQGVFGLFTPQPGSKYEEIYPRDDTEYPILKVH